MLMHFIGIYADMVRAITQESLSYMSSALYSQAIADNSSQGHKSQSTKNAKASFSFSSQTGQAEAAWRGGPGGRCVGWSVPCRRVAGSETAPLAAAEWGAVSMSNPVESRVAAGRRERALRDAAMLVSDSTLRQNIFS